MWKKTHKPRGYDKEIMLPGQKGDGKGYDCKGGLLLRRVRYIPTQCCDTTLL